MLKKSCFFLRKSFDFYKKEGTKPVNTKKKLFLMTQKVPKAVTTFFPTCKPLCSKLFLFYSSSSTTFLPPWCTTGKLCADAEKKLKKAKKKEQKKSEKK